MPGMLSSTQPGSYNTTFIHFGNRENVMFSSLFVMFIWAWGVDDSLYHGYRFSSENANFYQHKSLHQIYVYIFLLTFFNFCF